MQAVIMAGGKGTRLLSITGDALPKPMAPVLGKPMLEWQLLKLKENGINDIILVIGHLGDVIRKHFGDGSLYGVRIRYVEEAEPLGTAGAFFYLRDMLTEGEFFLVFGDLLFDVDLGRMAEFHRKKNARATLFVHPNAHPFDSDLVVTDASHQVLRFDSKHNERDYWYDNLVNSGLYILDHSLCFKIKGPVKTDLEKDLLTELINEFSGVYAYRSSEYVKDLGTPQRISDAERDIAGGYTAMRNLKNRQRAVFLDRDGTINLKNEIIYRDDQFELEPSAAKAIKKINDSGYLAIVITNQPAVARGLCSEADINIINNKMKTLLGREGAYLDDVKFCPHHPDKGYPEENRFYKIKCNCRKPNIGLIDDCTKLYNIDLSKSWIVGDSTIDIRTGKNAGIKTALVLTGDGGHDGKYSDTPDIVCDNLFDAVTEILEA